MRLTPWKRSIKRSNLGVPTLSSWKRTKNAFTNFKKNRNRIDLVFNIAEGLRGESRESHIPAILEFLEIPLHRSRDRMQRDRTRQIAHEADSETSRNPHRSLERHRLRRRWSESEKSENARRSQAAARRFEHRIDGKSSLKKNIKGAREKAEEIYRDFGQPAIVEEYLPGAEITVGILGNRKPQVLPLLEIYAEMYPTSKTKGLVTKEAKTILEKDAFSGPPRKLSAAQKEK